MSKNTLTPNQAAVINAIRQGLSVQEDEFTAVFDTFAADLADRGAIKDKKTAKVVLNQLTKKRLLAVDAETENLTLTDAGKFAMTELLFADEPEELAAQEAHLASLENEAKQDAPVVEETYLEATDEDLIGEVEKSVEQAEAFTATTWVDGIDEWTETVFNDGSKTLKRRRQVSGSWRTDYWGTEAGAEKKVYATAKQAKMARAYGTFNTAL